MRLCTAAGPALGAPEAGPQTRRMTTIITAREAQDFLALVPELAGFQPVESLVLIAFRGNRTAGALRVDLPSAARPDALSALTSSLVGMLCKIPDVDAVVPVVYTAARFTGSAPPHGEVVETLVFHAELSGFLVLDALCVAGGGWASYLDPHVPAGGRSLGLIADSPVNARRGRGGAAVPGGHAGPGGATLPERALHDQRGPDPRREPQDKAARQTVGRLVKRLRTMAGDPAALGEPSAELEALLDLVDVAELALCCPADSVGNLQAAALIFAMQSPPTRDMLLLHWAFGVEAGARAQQENLMFAAGDVGAGQQSAGLLWGEGPRPDPERIDAAIGLLLELLARCPRRYTPPVLSMLAWLCWALGQSSRAAVFVEMAREVDRGYGFAEVLGALLCSGRLPEWAFAVPAGQEESGVASGPAATGPD